MAIASIGRRQKSVCVSRDPHYPPGPSIGRRIDRLVKSHLGVSPGGVAGRSSGGLQAGESRPVPGICYWVTLRLAAGAKPMGYNLVSNILDEVDHRH